MMENYKLVVKDCSSAIVLDPTYARAFILRAAAHCELGSLEQAVADLNSAVALAPGDQWAYSERGRITGLLAKKCPAIRVEMLQQSVADFTKVIDSGNASHYVLWSRGSAYESLQKLELAEEDYGKAICLDPLHSGPILSRGIVRMEIKNFHGAVDDFSKCIELHTDDLNAYVWRSFAYLRLGLWEKAISDCDGALLINPKSSRAYNNRGYAFGKLGDHVKAVEDLGYAIEFEPTYCLAYENRAVSLRKLASQGEGLEQQSCYKLAIQDLSHIIEQFPGSQCWALGERGGCYYALQDVQNALSDFEQFLKLSEQKKQQLKRRSWALELWLNCQWKLTEYKKIVDKTSSELAKTDNPSLLLVWRARAYEKLEENEQALADYSKAVEIDPKVPGGMYGKARANFKVNFETKLSELSDEFDESY